MPIRSEYPQSACFKLPAWIITLCVIAAMAASGREVQAARPGAGVKVLVEDDNTLDVEQAFFRPTRRGRYEFSLTTAAAVATAVTSPERPIGSVMFQVDSVMRASPLSLTSILRLKLDDFAHLSQSTNLFFHQLYLTYSHPWGDVKLGKVMGQLGRLWDYGLYGPLIANTDFKLTPDLGISFEGEIARRSTFQLAYAVQFSPVDGRSVSVSNPTLFAWDKVRRKNIATLRLVPIYQAPRGFRVGLGASGQIYQAHQHNDDLIWRAAFDVQYQAGPLEAFFELGQQGGSDTPSGHTELTGDYRYAWAGTQLEVVRNLRLRHHVNIVRYSAPNPSTDMLQQPGIEYSPDPRLALVMEGAFWTSGNPRVAGEKSIYAFVIVSL